VAHFPALCHAVKLTDSERAAVLFVPPNPASVVHREKVNSRFFEIARVLVRFDHVARFVVNAHHGVPIRLAKLARFWQNSRSHRAVIRVYDDAGNVVETHEHKGDFKEW